MKQLRIFFYALVAIILFNSCEKEEYFDITGSWNVDRRVYILSLLGASLNMDDENAGVYTFQKDGSGTDNHGNSFRWTSKSNAVIIKKNNQEDEYRYLLQNEEEIILEYSLDEGAFGGVYDRLELSRL